MLGAVLLGDDFLIKEGDEVHTAVLANHGRIPVGDALISRMENQSGQPIDGKGATSD